MGNTQNYCIPREEDELNQLESLGISENNLPMQRDITIVGRTLEK